MYKIEQIDWKKVNKEVTIPEKQREPSHFRKTAYSFNVRAKDRKPNPHKHTKLVD
jgi:hypothetical protein